MPATPFPSHVTDWAALRTAARWEKKLADALAAVGVPVFLPLMTTLTKTAGKTRTADVPVFGGYVFCSAPDFLGNKAVAPPTRSKVAQVLRPSDPDQLRNELAALGELLTDRQLVQERMSGGIGDVVRITGGPLAGYAGTVIRTKPNRWQLVLEVSFLGARREVEVDERLVERAV